MKGILFILPRCDIQINCVGSWQRLCGTAVHWGMVGWFFGFALQPAISFALDNQVVATLVLGLSHRPTGHTAAFLTYIYLNLNWEAATKYKKETEQSVCFWQNILISEFCQKQTDSLRKRGKYIQLEKISKNWELISTSHFKNLWIS